MDYAFSPLFSLYAMYHRQCVRSLIHSHVLAINPFYLILRFRKKVLSHTWKNRLMKIKHVTELEIFVDKLR